MVKASVTEAASRLNVSVDSVRRRLRSGAIAGERDNRGQWWIDLAESDQPAAHLSVDQKLAVGVATPLQRREGAEELVDALFAQIDDLRARLDRSEDERRQDKEIAATERQALLGMIERLAGQGERN
ncbi:hypothetical protein [Ensifer sp. Root31]|uniref:hypothetical protein n=1 Tax=Ensifer sp. Root31 TaxID=1736512 RepID=UPI000AD2E08F|nr:hypothetical protein [Ensifer sp. Root31]